MEAFGRRYGFHFICHAIRHSNRKAGEERSFWTVETNFLRGRTYASLEDLNQQARDWSTERMEHRPQKKTGLIPAKAFEHEVTRLTPLPAELPAPYQTHERLIDQYGYVAFLANYYWIPGEQRGEVKVLRYANRIKLFQQGQEVAAYPLPAEGVKQQRFSPAGMPPPRYQPKNRRRPADAEAEANQLRAIDRGHRGYFITFLHLDATSPQEQDHTDHVEPGLLAVGYVPEEPASDGRVDRPADGGQSRGQHAGLQEPSRETCRGCGVGR